jgi:hypothetical protein
MKDKNCPICYKKVMGLSPEGWNRVQDKHEREHVSKLNELLPNVFPDK